MNSHRSHVFELGEIEEIPSMEDDSKLEKSASAKDVKKRTV